jgi:hypothetical protein
VASGRNHGRIVTTIRPFSLAGRRDRLFDVGKHGLEAALLVPVVYKHDGRYVQRPAAVLAGRRLTLRILQEPIGEVIFRSFPFRRLLSLMTTVRAEKLDQIFLRIAVQGGPSGVSNSYNLFGLNMTVHG